MGFKSVMKKVGKGALKVGKVAVPIALAATGVGLPAAIAASAALNAADKKASGGTWKQSLIAGGIGAGTAAIPGGGGLGGSIGGSVAKQGIKSLATGVAKGAATNFATGAGTSLATGQGLKNALKAGGSSAVTNLGTMGTGGFANAAKTVGKNVAMNAGGQLAAQGLQKAGLPGTLAAQGGNVFSNYLGNQLTQPGATPAGQSPKLNTFLPPQGQSGAAGTTGGGMDWKQALLQGGAGALGGAAGGGGWKGALGGGGLGTAGVALRGGGGGQSTNSVGYPNFVSGGAGQGGQDPPGVFRSTTIAPPPQSAGNLPQYTNPPVAADAGGGTKPGGTPSSGFWEKYGPLIAQGGGLVGGMIAGQQATKMAQKRSPEEMAALQGAQGSASQLGRVGGQLTQQGQDYQRAPGQYFQTLLSGNRAAMSQAVAGPTAQITGNYRGAERNLNQQGIRGASRDQAAADLNRQRVSQIAGLTTGMQPYAAEQLAKLGGENIQSGIGALATGGGLHQGLLNSGFDNRKYAREEGGKTGAAIGGLARDLGEVAFKKPAATPTPSQRPQPKPPGPNSLPINQGQVPMGPGVQLDHPYALPVGDYQVPTGPGVSIGTPPPTNVAQMPFNVGNVDFSGRQTTQMPFSRKQYF